MTDLWITWSPRDYPQDKAHNWGFPPVPPSEMWGEPMSKTEASFWADFYTRRGYGQSYAIPADTVRFTNYVRI